MTQPSRSTLLGDEENPAGFDLPFRVEKRDPANGWELVVAAASLGPALSAYFTAVRESPGHFLALKAGNRVLASSEDQAAIHMSSLKEEEPCNGPRVTERDGEVLRLLMSGLSMKQVAGKLGISPRTVAFHKYKVMKENRLRSNSELYRFIERLGLLYS